MMIPTSRKDATCVLFMGKKIKVIQIPCESFDHYSHFWKSIQRKSYEQNTYVYSIISNKKGESKTS